MMTLDTIDEISSPDLVHNEETFLTCFLVAQFRREVSELLKSMRSTRSTTSAQQISDLMQRIRETVRIRDHPIVPFLLEDLQQALTIRSENRMMSQEEATEMAQHSAYIGMSRGLRTTTSQVPPPLRLPLRRQRALGASLGASPLSQEAAPLSQGAAPFSQEEENSQGPITPPLHRLTAEPPLSPPQLFTSPTANAVQRQMLGVMRTMSMQPESP
jgi:hypothetical protein